MGRYFFLFQLPRRRTLECDPLEQMFPKVGQSGAFCAKKSKAIFGDGAP